MKIKLLMILILGLALSGCSEKRESELKAVIGQAPIIQERQSKDASFRSDEGSPIPSGERKSFQGLSYFPLDPALRFQAKLHRYAGPKQIRMATNTGEIRSGLLYGYFEFQVGADICKLQVYRLEDMSDGRPALFIPFRDATSGKETYGAGRYIDLMENTSGIYDLDFNRAYNPYCAYNPEYSCPLAPAENVLAIPIRAGERIYLARH